MSETKPTFTILGLERFVLASFADALPVTGQAATRTRQRILDDLGIEDQVPPIGPDEFAKPYEVTLSEARRGQIKGLIDEVLGSGKASGHQARILLRLRDRLFPGEVDA
jgi:hypothetical protein